MAQPPSFRVRPLGLLALFGLTVLGPVIFVGALTLWLAGREVERAVQDRLEEDVQLVARALQVPLSRSLEGGRATQLYEALESAFRIRRVFAAAVWDADGELVARVGGFDSNAANAGEVGRRPEEGRGGAYGQLGERPVYSYFVPLTSPSGRIEGLLQVARRRSDIEAGVRDVRIRMAVGFATILLVVGSLMLLTYQRAIGRHLNALSGAMEGVEGGERGTRLVEDGPRELAGMALSFNRMVTGVERAEAAVAKQREREATLEARLRRSEKLAAVGRLAAGVAHELGTPLSVVDGTAQRLERRGAARREVEAIRSAVDRMGRIVRELLAFGAQASDERQRVPVRSLLAGAAGVVQGEAEAQGVEMTLAKPPRDVIVCVDRLRMEAALTHLVRNAIQAAGEGGTVRVSADAGADRLAFVVEDSGAGVLDEHRHRLFEPFFTTKAVGQGSGLGLAVVHAVAEEHEGTVDVGRSSLGGARFSLVIPLENEP